MGVTYRVKHLVNEFPMVLELPRGYVPDQWEAWAWWGTGALESATRNLLDRACRSAEFKFTGSRAELLTREPLAGYTFAITWTPLDLQRYLEARYGGSDEEKSK